MWIADSDFCTTNFLTIFWLLSNYTFLVFSCNFPNIPNDLAKQLESMKVELFASKKGG